MFNTNQKMTKFQSVKSVRVISIAVILILMMSLTACQPKEPISADIYKEKVEALGYTVHDVTNQYQEFPHILKCLGNEADGLHMEFFEIDGQDNATGVFNSNKESIEKNKGAAASETSVNSGNYQKYTLKGSEKYYVLVRVGTTLIYSYCQKSDSEKLDSIIKDLSY